jgi:hypothetical protein
MHAAGSAQLTLPINAATSNTALVAPSINKTPTAQSGRETVTARHVFHAKMGNGKNGKDGAHASARAHVTLSIIPDLRLFKKVQMRGAREIDERRRIY